MTMAPPCLWDSRKFLSSAAASKASRCTRIMSSILQCRQSWSALRRLSNLLLFGSQGFRRGLARKPVHQFQRVGVEVLFYEVDGLSGGALPGAVAEHLARNAAGILALCRGSVIEGAERGAAQEGLESFVGSRRVLQYACNIGIEF